MGEVREKISIEFHLDEEGNVVDVISADSKCSWGDPEPPHVWASAIITTKCCIYVRIGNRWREVCWC